MNILKLGNDEFFYVAKHLFLCNSRFFFTKDNFVFDFYIFLFDLAVKHIFKDLKCSIKLRFSRHMCLYLCIQNVSCDL